MAKQAYGSEHQRRRAELLPRAYGRPCPRCGLPMLRGQVLQLGHTVDLALNPRAVGDRIEHQACNQKAGARTRNALAKYRVSARLRGLRGLR